jgi:AcrR family transcriptional regulator
VVSPAKPVARQRLTRAAREVMMLDAAEREFGEHGFRGASMGSIAQGAGITHAMLYQYFGSKEGLYEACVERARSTLFDDLDRAVAEHARPGEELRVFVEQYFAFVHTHRKTWSLLYGEATADVMDRMRERNAQAIGALLAHVLAERGTAPGTTPEDVAIVAHALTGAGEQVGRWWLLHPEVPEEVVVERFVALGLGLTGSLFARQ